MSEQKEPKTPSGAKKSTKTLKTTTIKEAPPKKGKKPPTDDQIIQAEVKEELAIAKELREKNVTLGKEVEIDEFNDEEDEVKSSEYVESDLEIIETASGNKV